MLTEVMRHYGLTRELGSAGYFETEHHRQLCREVGAAILAGRLVAITGMVGNGKTALLRHLQADLARENKVLVSKSLTVDQERTTVATLIDALFYDLSQRAQIALDYQEALASSNDLSTAPPGQSKAYFAHFNVNF